MADGVRVGCDVAALADIERSLTRFGSRYLHKVFTDSEIDDCAAGDRIAGLAARFAAKEAVIKAFAEPSAAFPLREIEIVKPGPVPRLSLSGSLATLAKKQHWRTASISLSHSDCHAVAAVFVLCGAS